MCQCVIVWILYHISKLDIHAVLFSTYMVYCTPILRMFEPSNVRAMFRKYQAFASKYMYTGGLQEK